MADVEEEEATWEAEDVTISKTANPTATETETGTETGTGALATDD